MGSHNSQFSRTFYSGVFFDKKQNSILKIQVDFARRIYGFTIFNSRLFVKNSFAICFLMGIFGLTGCATIVGDSTQTVQVNSNPQGAKFEIKDETGRVITSGITPQNVVLDKSDGSYFGAKDYQITFIKEGFTPTALPVKHSANGWYIGGNLLVGGLIGYLLVDPFNGGMYTLKPKEANVTLAAVQ